MKKTIFALLAFAAALASARAVDWTTETLEDGTLAITGAAAMKTFIDGLDTDCDGTTDIPGVSDIRLGLKSYARSGN